MTENPGAPRTDVLAENAALTQLINLLTEDDCPLGEPQGAASYLLAAHTVTWERGRNGAGVAVRRYVLRGEWEVDPEAEHPAHTIDTSIRTGDRVYYRDGRDGRRVWTVRSMSAFYLSMTSPGQDEVAEHAYVYRWDGERLLAKVETVGVDLTPEQHGVMADELGKARREGYVEALRKVTEAFSDQQMENWGASIVIDGVADDMGVTL